MADFAYRGRNSEGKMVEGFIQSTSKSAAVLQLKRQNVIAIKLEATIKKAEKKSGFGAALKNLERLNRQKVSIDELIMFSRQMYALTKSGIPLIQAINGLSDATRSPLLGTVLRDIAASLTQGITLSNAFRAHPTVFSDLFIAMISMGESTGRLDTAFEQLIDHLELEKDTRKKIKAATRYPIIVSVFVVLALTIINIFVIPQFSSIFNKLGADLPLPTIILIATSNFTTTYWPLILFLIVSITFAFIRWKKTPEGHLKWDQIILKIPIIGGVFERIALGRFARPFSMMLSAGVPLIQALTVTSKTVGNLYIGQGITGMLNGIERGETLLSTASSSGMFNNLILQMIAVGEETGNVSALLIDIADFYDQEVEYDLKRLADALEPILLVFMGIMVLILALGVFLPMWELGSALAK